MSYYGGGGGWGQPGFYLPNQGMGPPPPIQQPPPTAYFPSDPSAYPQGRGPYDYVQAGYNVSAPLQTHGHPVPGTHPTPELTPQTPLYSSVPPPQQQALTVTGGARSSPLTTDRGRTSLERSRDSRTPPRRRSPSPEDRYERRPAVSRRRDASPEEVRYRRRRSPSESPERLKEIPLKSKSSEPGIDLESFLRRDQGPEEVRYRRRSSPHGSPGRPYSGGPKPRGRSPQTFEGNYTSGRKDQSQLSREIPHKSKPEHSGVDLDALLKDERLRNVLFAGISKATAKLEQSLKQDAESKDSIAFHSGSVNDAKTQLFPSASTSGGSHQKPRSILKRKTDTDESGDAGAALNTLEKTLQMLRSKTDKGESSTVSSSEQSKSKVESKLQGALGQLVSYDDDNEEEAYLYGKKEKSPIEKKKASSNVHPFWSVDAVAAKIEEDNKATDTFEMKDKMFEKWRKSIQKSPEKRFVQSKDLDRDQSYEKEIPRPASRPVPGKSDENQEELDSTVQNILQSIGFDFDLSQRMQQLARKKKLQEEEKNTGISNLSASFLGKNSLLTEELRASLLQSGNDLSKIDSLLQEARASVHLERSVKRRERSPSPVTRRGRSPDEDRAVMIKDRLKAKMSLSDWPDQIDESRRRGSREYEASSSRGAHFLEDRGARSALRVLDDAKEEYFYPEKDQGEIPPGVPLLKSYSSRQKNEDLSSGLLKSMRVENFRVMSRPVYDDENEEFRETRRIILPAKVDRKVLSRSPSARDSRSPSYTRGVRKRSGSPISVSSLKERKLMLSRSSSFMEAQQKNLPYERMSPISHHSLSPQRSPNDREATRRRDSISPPARRKLSGARRSSSPKGPRSKYRQRDRSRSPNFRRSRSPRRYRSRSPIWRRSRSRSPKRRRSRSRSRHRRSPPRYSSPLKDRRRPLPRRSPEKKSSHRTDPKTSIDKKGMGASKKETDVKSKVSSGQPQTPHVDLSKMTDDERKSHLKKMLSPKDSAPVVAQDTPKEEQSDNVKTIVESFEKLSSALKQDQKAELATKLKLLSTGDRSKVLDNVKSRFSKIMLLKIEVVKLKRLQNELMRKNQRRGIGSEDPQLSFSERKQARIEKEIERLSATELEVEVGEFSLEEVDESLEKNSSQTPKDVPPSTPSNKTGSKKKTTGNLIEVPLCKPGNKKNVQPKLQSNKAAESNSKVEASGKKKTSVPVTKDEKKKSLTPSERGKNSWTSVDVKDELPAIDEGDTLKRDKTTKKAAPSSTLKSATKKKIYFEYIDSGNHFCRQCHATCNTLSQFFEHLHGKKHVRAISKLPKPWDEPKLTKGKNLKVGQAQSRRIKGSELIIPVTGFYCSLCKVFCGDFCVAENHLKSDSHYDKYLDYIRDNPKYEKNLLLEKTKSPVSNIQKKNSQSMLEEESLSAQEKEEKGREKKAHFRVKTEDPEKEDDDFGAYDQIGAVDMELDEDDRDDDRDVQSKVPKMVPKPLPFIPPPPPEPAIIDTMKTNQEDEDQSLDIFLALEPDADEGKKIPVVCSHPSIDLSSIPVPSSAPPSVPKVKHIHTVKSLQEVQNEEKKAIDEEKRMMGIDVDAEEEKPLAAIKRPPVLENLASGTSTDSPSKKSTVDNLFAKLNKSAAQKRKPKVVTVSGNETTEMEMRIQQEIAEKLNKEKEKLLRVKQKEEERERRREEKKVQKKKIYSSSESSSDDSEEDNEVSLDKKAELIQIPLPDASTQKPPTEQKPALEAEVESAVDGPSSSLVTKSPAIDSSVDDVQTNKDIKEDVPKSHSLATSTPVSDISKNEIQTTTEKVPKLADIIEEKSNNEDIIANVEISEVSMGVQEDVLIQTVRKGKTPIKKKKNAAGSVSASESDLSKLFSSSLETVSRDARKKLNKKGRVKKRGTHPEPSQNAEGKEIDMEDYVVLSEVTEEDEGSVEDVEMKDEVLLDVLPDTSSEPAENNEASLQVKEIKEEGDLTKNIPNQELEEESLSKVERNLKADTASEDKMSGDDGLSVGEEKKERETVEEPSVQSSDNGQHEKHTDKGQELLSTPTVDEEYPEEKNLRNNASGGGKLFGDDGHPKSVELKSVEETVEEPSAQPTSNWGSEKRIETQDLSSASIAVDEVPKEENLMNIAAPDEKLYEDYWHSNSVGEMKMEVEAFEEPSAETSNNVQSARHTHETQEASILDHDIPSESEKRDVENIHDENYEPIVPVLTQEVPVTSPGQLSQLRAPTLGQEFLPALEKDTENATEETSPALSVPATAHRGGRGRGKKSGGRGRGRGKRTAKKGRVDDSSTPTDEFLGQADEKPLIPETPSVADALTISTNEADSKTAPSPIKRGRRGKAPSSSRRVTRSRVNQILNEEGNDENSMNEPEKAVIEVEKHIDVMNEREKAVVADEKQNDTMNEPEKAVIEEEKQIDIMDEPEKAFIEEEKQIDIMNEPEKAVVEEEKQMDTMNELEKAVMEEEKQINIMNEPEKAFMKEEKQIDIMNEPEKTVSEEVKQLDISVLKSSTITSQSDGQMAPPKSVEDMGQSLTSTEVEIKAPETESSSLNPDVSVEDVQMIPVLTEQPNLFPDTVPLPDLKDEFDSDATITEDQDAVCLNTQVDEGQGITLSENSSLWEQSYEDSCKTENTSVTSVMQEDVSSLTSHLHANQPIDPPMSGIVSEIEAPDNIMDVDGDGADDGDTLMPEANIPVPESEGLPTSGLGLDLEDVTDSISFPLDDDNIKTDSSEPM